MAGFAPEWRLRPSASEAIPFALAWRRLEEKQGKGPELSFQHLAEPIVKRALTLAEDEN